MEDKKRIVNMVKEGKITVEEAIRLLEAMEQVNPPPTRGSGYAYAVATNSPPQKGIARMVRIQLDAVDVKLKVNLPAALAKFAANFIPPETKSQLGAQGIDIDGILDMVKGELPEGRLVDLQVNEVVSEKYGATKVSGPVKILIEVV